jgi:hypothetical protein
MKDDRKGGVTGEGTSDEAGSFLGRWSRRKVAAREGKPLPEPARASELPAHTDAPQNEQRPAERRTDERAETRVGDSGIAAGGTASPELPSIESLRGLESEYGEFLRPDVDEETRRAALKKLFADPHFNRMDGLDVYIDDYSQPDPIPAAMLRTLSHAKGLLFAGEEHEDGAGTKDPGTAPVRDAAVQKTGAEPAPEGRFGDSAPTAAEIGSSCPDPSPLSRKIPDSSGQG